MRRAQMEAARFLNAMLHLPCKRIAVENLVPHRHAAARIGQYTQTVQFGSLGTGVERTPAVARPAGVEAH